MVGAEFGGRAGQVEGGVDDFDGEMGNVFDDFARDAGAVGATCVQEEETDFTQRSTETQRAQRRVGEKQIPRSLRSSLRGSG